MNNKKIKSEKEFKKEKEFRKEISKENIRNIQKSNRSYYITLPISVLRKLGWDRAGKPLVVYQKGRKIFIEEFNNQIKNPNIMEFSLKLWKRKIL
mgnify:CR=1 FL=1